MQLLFKAQQATMLGLAQTSTASEGKITRTTKGRVLSFRRETFEREDESMPKIANGNIEKPLAMFQQSVPRADVNYRHD